MLNLCTALRQTQTKSVLDLRSALSSQSSSVTELLQINFIHQHYLSTGGRDGPLGFPTSEVQFSGDKATRQFRGGGLQLFGDKIHILATQDVSVRFLGFKCVEESAHDQLSPHDEPYFIISADTGNGAPAVKKFGEYEGIDTDDEIGVGELLIQKVPLIPWRFV